MPYVNNAGKTNRIALLSKSPNRDQCQKKHFLWICITTTIKNLISESREKAKDFYGKVKSALNLLKVSGTLKNYSDSQHLSWIYATQNFTNVSIKVCFMILSWSRLSLAKTSHRTFPFHTSVCQMASSTETFWLNTLHIVTISFLLSSCGKQDIFQNCIPLYSMFIFCHCYFYDKTIFHYKLQYMYPSYIQASWAVYIYIWFFMT